MKKEELENIKRLWEKESDEWLIKAIYQDSKEYPKDVLLLIRDIAKKRKLIKSCDKFDEGNDSCIKLSEKGLDIKTDLDKKKYNRKTSTIFKRLLISIPIIFIWAILSAIIATNAINDRLTIWISIPAIVLLCVVWGIKDPFGFLPIKNDGKQGKFDNSYVD
ncbi:MAG: hypothetical protein H8E62_02480 [Planctomycetes bacterium]|nr:hypothetical protein [Planctomycetota bacterium]